MREIYKGYTLISMSRAFTPKELFQAVQIRCDGMTVHDCLIGDMERAKAYVDSLRGGQGEMVKGKETRP